jgi:hypothetical protein
MRKENCQATSGSDIKFSPHSSCARPELLPCKDKRSNGSSSAATEAETEAVVLRLQRQLSYLWASTQSAEAQAKSVHEGWMRLVQSFLDKFPPTPTLPLPPSTSSSSSAPPPQTQLLNHPEGNEQKIISLQS